MKSSISFSLAGLALVSTLAFTLREGSAGDAVRSSFSASVAGDVSARSQGEAEFGLIHGEPGDAPALTVSLGARSGDGAVVFTRVGGPDLMPGVYPISEEGDVRALVVTGTPAQPTGVFRAESGVLTVTEASDKSLRGEFRLGAKGFLASAPADESRRVSVSGEFTAVPASRN